jgi:hypothetical protein
MKKIILTSLLGIVAWLGAAVPASAQVPPAAYPYYIPQGSQRGTYGFPLYFAAPGASSGVMMTYNFGSGRVREFNYGMFLPGGIYFSRGLGGANGTFNVGATTFYDHFLPGYPGARIFAPFYSGPMYYLPTY